MMPDNRTPTTEHRPKSLLSGFQRCLLVVAMTLAGLLIANTLYLLGNRLISAFPETAVGSFAQGTRTISYFFQAMVLSHTGLGFVVVGLLVGFAIWHLPTVWRRHRRQTVVSGLAFVSTGLVLAATGPFIMYAAATRDHSWVWWTHLVAAAVVPVAYVLHRSVSYVRPARGNYARFTTVLTTALIVMFAGHVYTARGPSLTPEALLAKAEGSNTGPGSKQRDLMEFVDGVYVPPGFVPPGSPFFPSAATTTTGGYLPERIITRGDTSSPEKLAPDLDTIGFVVNEKIGAETCDRCHADIVEQWSRSAHRFASFNNPFYEATINDMRKNALALTEGVAEHMERFPQWKGRTGEIKSKWCSGCHDPSLMLAGEMTDPIDRRSPQAQAGLTCLACHAIDEVHSQTGNGHYNVADEQEDPFIFPTAATGTLAALLHDTAIKAKPEVHKRDMLKPVFRTAEFCSACHKVSLPEPVNNYRWFRGQNEFDAWHDSGVALNASRTFYLPPNKRVCQDCHMPLEPAVHGDFAAKDGMVKSHRFLAVNTALPFIRGDDETIRRIEAFLRDEKLRIDVFALVRDRDGEADTVYALNHRQPELSAGETVTFDVVVRNLGAGHTFPGGTNDSNESWVEFTLVDDHGERIVQSGYVREDGYVDPTAHYFRAVIVDRHGEPIRRRNAQDIYAPVYVNVIGPGTAQVVHYRMTVPPELAGRKLTVEARLMWRKFDRAYTEFAFTSNRAGFKRFDDVPNLPITEICRSEVSLPVVGPGETPAPSTRDVTDIDLAADWLRFNDYGIGLLLQDDTKAAQRAFAEVGRLVPERIDGPRNLARVALRDGELETAYDHLLRCEEIRSNDAQTAWFWGVLLQEDGRYVEAASAYKRVLDQFPEDRATWGNLGRTYYLDGKYRQSIEAMTKVLAIDPEDRVAHYHIMLAARAVGDELLAANHEEAYLRYKIDESQAEVTKSYRLKNPHDNLESQSVHVHDLSVAGSERVTRRRDAASEGTR